MPFPPSNTKSGPRVGRIRDGRIRLNYDGKEVTLPLAYDEAPAAPSRPAMDAEGTITNALMAVAKRMDRATWASLWDDMNGNAEGQDDGPDAPADPLDARQDFAQRILGTGAEDEPPSFRGMPLPGGGKAMDAKPKGDSFADRFPDAARVKINNYGTGR